MAERKEFIKSIRERLGEYHPTRAPEIAWTPERERPQVREPGRGELPELFLAELQELGGHGKRLRDLAEAREYVLELVSSRSVGGVIRWTGEPLDSLGVDEPLRQSGVEVTLWRESEELREKVAVAEVGISTAAGAIAQTGSLILTSDPRYGRTVTLLPPTYVAIVPAERIMYSLPEALEWMGREELPRNFCFHTGPSRSGDIEQSLAIGVHGPGDVHVLIIEEGSDE